jgi:ATP-dependent Lhr-like helicase
LTDEKQRFDDSGIRLRGDLTHEMWKTGTVDALQRLCLPEVDERALQGLKFSEALPRPLAEATLAERMADLDGAATVLREPARFVITYP